MLTDLKPHFLSREVYEIYASCMFNPAWEKFAAKAQDYAESADIQCFGWTENGSLAGVIVLDVPSGEILGIAVHRDLRGCGVGRRMIAALPASVLRAETDDDAVGFYSRCGFTIEPFVNFYDGQPVRRYRCTLRR